MRFWDSSALVPLLILETTSEAVQRTYAEDGQVTAWWASTVECASAIARRGRETNFRPEDITDAMQRLSTLAADWSEVEPADRVRQLAMRMVRVHPLRVADALQLAAAEHAAEGDPRSLPFVTLDDRLADVASREGFPVIVPRAA
jgi:uncharacterized protein